MADSGDEADSRTASVGMLRARKNQPVSRPPSTESSRPTKRRRRNRSRTSGDDLDDMVPKGASFTAHSLEVDPDETSSSGSDSDSDSDSSDSSDSSSTRSEVPSANPHIGSTAPAISWNQGRKAAVRTTLGKRKADTQAPSQSTSQFESTAQPLSTEQPEINEHKGQSPVKDKSSKQFKAVNGAYWRSRSASVSSGGEEDGSEEGEVNTGSDTDDSELDSEADDSLMLNIGGRSDGADETHTESRNGTGQTEPSRPGSQSAQSESKEAAFKRFAKKYPTAPVILLDLHRDDMDLQAKLVYWDRDVHAIDLQLPVGCLECLRPGHLAEVCPTKECVHCNAWNVHPSTQCPTWRRCQRCRARGHLQDDCPSLLKGSAAEVPCDYCGSTLHMESDCQHTYSQPTREAVFETITVSISCAHCTSASHLIGDCPHLPVSLQQRTRFFTLKDADPTKVNNLNVSDLPRKAAPPPPPTASRGKGRRGGGGNNNGIRSPPSNSEEDMMPRKGARKGPPPSRGRGRGSIKFGNSTAFDQPRGKPPPPPSGRPKGAPNRGGGGGGGGGNRGRGRGRGGRARGGR
ncbi:Zinc finger CCHC-type domain-containing protein [Penicillium ucsense]|uniref:Zinc finger CCHC-type domain-containing protein n=1 Tax=Penicillium ucsense TaxID=2839758 RepID=A0A8J8W6H6_9EURO|nr:Zinc finger CCHC-type domain-containing protein [Penicillium ucsense]KAF7736376.1 Zinc finger CCHC-type domain-containing protein [Penicillium ucsense]